MPMGWSWSFCCAQDVNVEMIRRRDAVDVTRLVAPSLSRFVAESSGRSMPFRRRSARRQRNEPRGRRRLRPESRLALLGRLLETLVTCRDSRTHVRLPCDRNHFLEIPPVGNCSHCLQPRRKPSLHPAFRGDHSSVTIERLTLIEMLMPP